MVEFYKNKRVLITGHTGFKGSWLTFILKMVGSDIIGYSLAPPTEPNLFKLAGIGSGINSIIGDVRDYEKLKTVFNSTNPEIVLHLAAQPLVRTSYSEPRYTYETNVMGTVNLLECVRNCKSVRSVLNVTTDKVYENKEWTWGYRENESLDGYDPYSNSKSCSELVTHSYVNSFFKNSGVSVATARAGNVIGGGDFSTDRIIPDCVRAATAGMPVIVRNSQSIRPYQHVLEPLFAYLLLTANNANGAYNVGPQESDCITTGELVDLFCQNWQGASWIDKSEPNAPHEAGFLRLDSSKIKSKFAWKPKWNIETAMQKAVEWYKSDNPVAVMEQQIKEYIG
jgi:CDP-glucose 4,6-dehydratase